MPTTYVSATKLQAAVAATDIASALTSKVTVSNPAPGGGTSAAVSVGVIATPVVAAGTAFWVYDGGRYNWAGDWSSGTTINYQSTGVKSLSGGQYVIEMPSGSQWEIWLPYPPSVAASASSQPPNSVNVGGNGVGFDTTGYKYLTFSIWPTQSGSQVLVQLYEANGTTTDIGLGGLYLGTGAYGPGTMTANQWNTYKVPLTALNISAAGQWIYKFGLQQQGTTPQTWYIDQVGFTAD